MGVIVHVPRAGKVVRIRVLRGTRIVETTTRTATRDGVMELRLPRARNARRAMSRGVYTVQVQVGQDLQHLGQVAIKRFLVV
jgi:hypothetical protein